MKMNLSRKNISKITPYIAGKPIEETKRELGLKEVIKLASNENPLGASPKALSAIRARLGEINRYPDSNGFYLKARLAKELKREPKNIILGNGSDEIIDIIIKTFVEDDEFVLTSEVTFLEYGIISQVNNRKVLTAPLKDFKYDLKALSRRINNKTKVVFIANPNNPTGTYVNTKDFKSFIADLPKAVIVVLDEAYDAFIDVKDFPDSRKFIDNGNVIAMKTFSKAYGLAGLRIGYAVSHFDLISAMEKTRQPFNVNLLAQVGASAALLDKEFLRRTQNAVWEGKAYICKELQKLGVSYIPSVANFILIDVKKDGVGVFKDMLKQGVIVRDMSQYGLKNFIRVTIGTKQENKRFIEVLRTVLGCR